MPGVVSRTPAKRVLAETTNTAHNIKASPHSAKKRKLESPKKFRKPAGPNGALGSSQPKSQFEEEVLEKLSQNIDGLRKNNQEKDQQWARPSLADFNPDGDNLIFQQIEVEEGTLHGGKAALKLFGVTEVSGDTTRVRTCLLIIAPERSFSPPPCYRLPALSLRRSTYGFHAT